MPRWRSGGGFGDERIDHHRCQHISAVLRPSPAQHTDILAGHEHAVVAGLLYQRSDSRATASTGSTKSGVTVFHSHGATG